MTGSDAGGITKVGRFWENYDLLFKAHILYNCIGVIIRAESLSSYYMFQIHKDCIIPHRRSLIRVKESSLDVDEKGLIKNLKIAPGLYIVGWNTDDKVPLQKQIDGWFDCKITASGSSVAVYINGIIVFEDKEFLQIPTGKIGFRNDGPEKAIVKDIKVITKQSF